MYIRDIPGEVMLPDGTITNIAELLGLTPIEVTAGNDGRSNPPVAVMTIGDKDYSLGDVLKAVGEQLSGAKVAVITKPNANFKTTPAFADIKGESKLDIVWGNKHANDVTFTKSGSTVTAVVATFISVDTSEDTLTVTTFTINTSGTSKEDTVYDLTDHT